MGRLERSFEFFTNDPRNPTIKLTVSARVKPLPDFVRRIQNANLAHGDTVGDLSVWPSASPSLILNKGEALSISLRIRSRGTGELAAAPLRAGMAVPGASEVKLPQLAIEDAAGLACKLRPESDSYWLDVQVGPFSEPGTYLKRIVLRADPEPLTLSFSIVVPDRAISVAPKSLDLGSAALSDLKQGLRQLRASINLRKQVGSFRVKSVSTDLAFLKLELVAVVEGSNYLIRVKVDPAAISSARSFEGSIRIETDDPNEPLIEVPCKVALSP